MPTFISGEGSGKGTLFKLFEKMLGNEKVFETTNPNRDVWGDFNGMMCNCFLVNLNELSKKDTMDAEGKIKGLITDNTLAINQKGIPQYKIKSYHRFITTTNKEEPVNTTNGDRRNLIIRSSDEIFPVVDEASRPFGFVTRNALIHALANETDGTPVSSLMNAIDETLNENDNLEKVLSRFERDEHPAFIVTEPSGRAIGLLTRASLAQAILVHTARPGWHSHRGGLIAASLPELKKRSW